MHHKSHIVVQLIPIPPEWAPGFIRARWRWDVNQWPQLHIRGWVEPLTSAPHSWWMHPTKSSCTKCRETGTTHCSVKTSACSADSIHWASFWWSDWQEKGSKVRAIPCWWSVKVQCAKKEAEGLTGCWSCRMKSWLCQSHLSAGRHQFTGKM